MIQDLKCNISGSQFNIHAKVKGLLYIDKDSHSKPIILARKSRVLNKLSRYLMCFARGKGALSFLSLISISPIHMKFSIFNKGSFNSYREVVNHLNIAY